GKAAQTKGAEQPAKGKPAPAGKSGKGKPATQEPTQGPGKKKKKKNHRGGRSQAARANPEARGAERRERKGTDPVVLVEGPGTVIPEPRTPAENPAGAGQGGAEPSSESSLDTAPPKVPVFTGPVPGEDTPDFGGSDSEGEREEPAERVTSPASAEAAAEPAEEGNPELAEQYGEALTLLDEISQADPVVEALRGEVASGGGHLLKSTRLPTAFKGCPAELEVARKCKVPLQMAAMTEEVRTMSVRLFGMLGSWTQDSATAVKLARGVKGLELWRLLWQEHNPENESKNLTWRRTLLMPKFPPKESDFSLALQEWEADVDRYASEYGAGRALADEDLRAVLVTESPNALRQHLAMHVASLSTYAEVREVVVSYLQAKRVWTPSAGYAASSRRDPNAMDIGRIGDRDGKEGKGKGDKGNKGKGDKDHKKGKGDHDNKGKKGDKKGNQQGGRDGKERCPICWKTGHTVKECWFNAKGKGKGNKGQVAQVADDAATTLSTASLATAGPSASQAGGSTGGSGGKGQVRQEDKILKVSGNLLVDSGACVSVCRPEAFPDLQPAGPPKSLYSVDNSRLKTKGRVAPAGVNKPGGSGGGRPSPGRDLGHYEYIPEHDLEAREVEDTERQATPGRDPAPDGSRSQSEVERLEPPGEPWLFNDEPRPDDEALLVEGAEQASRLPDASPTEELANADIPDYEPSDVEAAPAAASALPQQAASPAPAANDGSGEGGRDSAGSSASAAAAQQPPAAKSPTEPKKAPRLGALTEREVWQHIAALADPPLTNHQGERDAWVGQVTDLLDRMLDPKQVEQARKEQLRKLWDRGQSGCVFLDRRSGLILLHHIDDIRVAGPKAAVLKFTELDLPQHCEITVGELEEPGTAVEVLGLGRTKVRTEDSILTLPDSKHAENVCEQLGIGPKDKGPVPSKPLDLTKVEELSAGDAARFRSAVGSAICLAAETLARYLRATPRFGRVVVLDPTSKSTALLNLEVYSDSDWAGCPETRRSTDNIVACLGDAEIRGVSRAAREAVFLRELAEKDFALACGKPRLWADSAGWIGAAKRIGPGSKLRHLEVAEFYVQGALRAKLLELRKVKGTENPANFATKHAKTGPEVRQSLPSMGMVDLDAVAGATEALAQKGTIKTIQASPWKMRPPTKLASSALMATIVALQEAAKPKKNKKEVDTAEAPVPKKPKAGAEVDSQEVGDPEPAPKLTAAARLKKRAEDLVPDEEPKAEEVARDGQELQVAEKRDKRKTRFFEANLKKLPESVQKLFASKENFLRGLRDGDIEATTENGKQMFKFRSLEVTTSTGVRTETGHKKLAESAPEAENQFLSFCDNFDPELVSDSVRPESLSLRVPEPQPLQTGSIPSTFAPPAVLPGPLAICDGAVDLLPADSKTLGKVEDALNWIGSAKTATIKWKKIPDSVTYCRLKQQLDCRWESLLPMQAQLEHVKLSGKASQTGFRNVMKQVAQTLLQVQELIKSIAALN
ncbi:true, partial [Symbiodinium sp. CCMP2592]